MAKVYANRVWMTTATAGTGTITLGSAVAGYFTFAEGGIANADTVSYVIIDGNDFEVGVGTYTSSGTTMSRDTVIASKIGGVAGTTKITLSGSAEVFLSPNEADLAFTDIANVFTETQTIKSTDASAALGPVLQLTRDSASPAVSDILGHISFFGRDSAANLHQYGAIYAAIASPTNGAEAGALYLTPASTAGSGQLALNYGAADWWNTTTYSLLSLSRYQNAVDGDIAGLLQFAGQSDTGVYRQWGQILSYVDDSANAAEDSSLGFTVVTGGTLTEAMRLYGDGLLRLYSADAGAAEGPVLELNRNSASPAIGDLLGQLKFYGRNYAGTERQGFRVTGIHGYSDATYEEWYIRFSGYHFDSGVTNATFDLFELESNGSALVLPGPYGAPQLAIMTENTGTTGGRLSFNRWVGTGVGGAVANGDELGNIWWSGFDGTTFFLGTARIESDVDGTPGTNDQPTRLTFWTTPDGTVGPLERMRISNDGTVRLYSTDAGAGAGPILDLYRDSVSPAANDIIGQIAFYGEDSAGNKQLYGSIKTRIDDPTNGSEDALIILTAPAAGSSPGDFVVDGNGISFNHTTALSRLALARYQNLADGDTVAEIYNAGYSSSGNYTMYGLVQCVAEDATDATENGQLNFQLVHDGTEYVTRQRFSSDGQITTFSNAGANKGHVPATHWVMLTADYNLSNSGSEQKFFNTTTNGALTLPAGVYEFEAFLYVTTMSGTSGNLAFDPVGAGTATTDRWGYHASGIDNSSPLSAGTRTGSASVTQQSVASIVTAGTGTGMVVHVTGMFRVTAGGTIIPSITLVTANAAVAKAGSWFKCAKIGETTETSVGAWT
jgi:hypothetical protein